MSNPKDNDAPVGSPTEADPGDTRPSLPRPAEAAKRPCLTVLHGGEVGRTYWLSEAGAVIGRTREASLMIADDTVSRRHAQIVFDGSHYVVRDLSSRNGTYCNGSRIEQHVLVDGDKILIGGNVLLRFDFFDEADSHFQGQLRSAMARDLVTGLGNEQHLRDRLTQEIAYARRHATHVSMVMIALDNLPEKAAEAEAALIPCSRLISNLIRAEDIVGRVGRKTFAVVCRGVDTAGVRVLGDRIRTRIRAEGLEGTPTHQTVSVGVAESGPPHDGGHAALWSAAETALALARYQGGDQVAIADEPGPGTGKKSG